jgi:outer membrane protein TolC
MKRLLFIIAVLNLTTLNAQQTFRSLEEVWAYADEHNIQVTTGKANQAIAQKNIGLAYGALLPVVTVNGAFTDNIQIQSTLVPAELFGGEPGTFREEEFGKRYVYNAGLTAQIDILNVQNWFEIKSARYAFEYAAHSLAKARYDLYAQIANACYTSQLMDEASVLASENLAISKETCQTLSRKYSEGQVNEVTINNAQINLKKAEINLSTARQNKLTALNTLKQLLGLLPNDSLHLELNAVVPSIGIEEMQFSPYSSAEIKTAQADMLVSKANWQAATATYVPTLSVVYSAGRQITGDDFFSFNNTNSLPQQYWGLRLSIPLLAGNTRSFQNAKARIEFDTKKSQYENAIAATEINDQNLTASYLNASAAFYKAKEILELYMQNDLHAYRKMTEGLISVDERLRVYQDYVAYQNEYLQAMAGYFIQYYSVKIRQKTF